MTLRGLISPPRSRSSPRDFRPHSINNNHNNAATNPPSRPNYMSPSRRPTTVEQQTHTHTHRKPTANAIRATRKSPPRIRPSSKSKPATPIVPSRRPTAAPNPYDLQNQKKVDSRTTAKIASGKPSSSPRTQQQRLRNGATPKPKPATASASRSDSAAANSNSNSANLIFDSPNNSSPKHLSSHGSGQRHDMKNRSPCSGGSCNSFADPQLNNHLQHLSIYGKDLANIILHANSIYESVGSDTKEEASSSSSSSSQSNASKIFKIYKDIASHRQGNSSITTYFTKLKTLWDELETYNDVPQCSCGAMEKLSEHMEKEKVMQFLMGLDDSYSTICPQILLIQPFPTVEKVYSVIIREEKRRELVLSLEIVAEKVMQNKWLLQNDQLGIGDGHSETVDNNVEEHQVDDQNGSGTMMPPSIYDDLEDVEISSFPNEPLLIDLGSPVRC